MMILKSNCDRRASSMNLGEITVEHDASTELNDGALQEISTQTNHDDSLSRGNIFVHGSYDFELSRLRDLVARLLLLLLATQGPDVTLAPRLSEA